ncbi:MAG TPA: Ig domain-containing protein [Geobacteraceae bacterium]|nr:Ig domain-containing protein [Geobacteraceae bacterium]
MNAYVIMNRFFKFLMLAIVLLQFAACGSDSISFLPPAIISANHTAFTEGTAGSFKVTAIGIPAPTLSINGTLPQGVTFDASTGVLSGTPATGSSGTYPLTITATNGLKPDATQSFTLTVAGDLTS